MKTVCLFGCAVLTVRCWQVAGCVLELPVHLSDPAARLASIRTQLGRWKASHGAQFAGLWVRWGLSLVPSIVLPRLVRSTAKLASCIGVSSVRVPYEDAKLCGVDILSCHYIGVFRPARIPWLFSISTIRQRLVVALAVSGAKPCDVGNMLVGIPTRLDDLHESLNKGKMKQQ